MVGKEEFSVSFLIGATDEVESLKTTVKKIIDSCEPGVLDKIVIVKAQFATRECSNTLSELEKAFPDIVLAVEQKREHIGGYIRDGVDNIKSSHFVIYPSDLAIGFESIVPLIEKEKQNPKIIVKTSRWLVSNSFHNYSPVRKFFNRIAQSFLRVLYGSKLTDLTNPAQIMPTDMFRSINWKEIHYTALLELVLCPVRLGVRIIETPTSCYGRTEGKSGNGFWQTAMYLKTALRIRFTKPKKLLITNKKNETN